MIIFWSCISFPQGFSSLLNRLEDKYSDEGLTISEMQIMNLLRDVEEFNESSKNSQQLVSLFNKIEKEHFLSANGVLGVNDELCLMLYFIYNDMGKAFSLLSGNFTGIGNYNEGLKMTEYMGVSIKRASECLVLSANAGNDNALSILKSVSSSQTPSFPALPNYDTPPSSVTQQTCSMCGGKGWVAGFKTPTYGNMSRYWCNDCHEEVGASHSHDECPSCRGTGQTPTIR